MRRFLAALAVSATLAAPALAGPSAEAARAALEGGGLEAGVTAMAAKAAADNEARFGEGLLRFARAVERYGQAQYKYGLKPPRSLAMPLLRLPVPPNPDPATLDYAAQRATLAAFLADLKAAEAALAKVDGEVKIVVDLNAVTLDFVGAGKPGPDAKLGAIIAALRMAPPQTAGAEKFEAAFDRGDALWLQGYCNLLSALLEFGLAHDWSESFSVAAHLFYPKVSPAALAGKPRSALGRQRAMFGESGDIADAIGLIHTIRWPVVEPARMLAARGHLLKVIGLSRASWKAILAETDDDREWVPAPKQASRAVSFAPVGQEQVDGWLAALDDFEAALNGRKLVPHWRFEGGFNLSRFFSEPRPFDLLLWTTGHAAAPYVEQGEAFSMETWTRWQQIFRGQFFGYALWFN